jgi:hypothetical protein
MRRYCIILFLLILSGKSFGFSFPEYPLMTMIEKSEFIVYGVVIDTFKTDSITKKQIIAENRENRKKRLCWCGSANKTAKIKILTTLKGQKHLDTIFIPYHSSGYYALPGFNKTDTLILFLNKFGIESYYGKTDPRFGVKTASLADYIKYTKTYLDFSEKTDSLKAKLKFNWLIDLACNSSLTWEGTKVLRNLSDTVFTDTTKLKLTKSLLGRETLKRKDEYLLEIVSEFGFNKEVFDYCVNNLEKTLNDDLYYMTSLDLMQAIYEMDKKRKYEKLIDDYFDTFYKKKDKKESQLAIIQDFIIETKKH